jgi:[ribosomal protein S18]-alanine N-acetyltransferase
MAKASPVPPPADESSRLDVRALSYTDLPAVLAIERRAFPTPWSLAMFVLELSKQTGICLAAVERSSPGQEAQARARPGEGEQVSDGRLVGYLICSRYDTVWHIMNVAVDVNRQREGLASRLLSELYDRVGDENARYTLEVRRSNAIAIHLYEREGFRAAGMRRRYYQDNGEDALVMWRTPGTREGLLDDVPNPGPA